MKLISRENWHTKACCTQDQTKNEVVVRRNSSCEVENGVEVEDKNKKQRSNNNILICEAKKQTDYDTCECDFAKETYRECYHSNPLFQTPAECVVGEWLAAIP